MAESNKTVKKQRFKTVSDAEKEIVLKKRKAENTNLSTQQWITCLREYLIEKQLPELESIQNAQLGEILGKFYLEARKKRVPYIDVTADENQEEVNDSYKTTSLRAARGAFTRYFKDTRKIDIRTHDDFVECNQIFLSQTKVNKEKGLGSIENKPTITDQDMRKIHEYFKNIMEGPPNPRGLLQIVVFHILYYLCRRGRENLRSMKKTTFDIAKDENNVKYIYQKEDEADKNHGPSDTSIANQGRIYERPGEFKSSNVMCVIC